MAEITTTSRFPRWVDVTGACRCSECGELVARTWRLFESNSVWTRALCTACTSKNLAEVHG